MKFYREAKVAVCDFFAGFFVFLFGKGFLVFRNFLPRACFVVRNVFRSFVESFVFIGGFVVSSFFFDVGLAAEFSGGFIPGPRVFAFSLCVLLFLLSLSFLFHGSRVVSGVSAKFFMFWSDVAIKMSGVLAGFAVIGVFDESAFSGYDNVVWFCVVMIIFMLFFSMLTNYLGVMLRRTFRRNDFQSWVSGEKKVMGRVFLFWIYEITI